MEMLSRQEILTRNELMTLIQSKYSPSVSLYMPTSWIGADMQQNQIRFKNLLRTAAERLSEYGVRPAEIEDMLAPAQTLHRLLGYSPDLADAFAETFAFPVMKKAPRASMAETAFDPRRVGRPDAHGPEQGFVEGARLPMRGFHS